ncbi:ABC transporter substrate-binding protein [Bdellovibrio sp. HCB337]|uniref:ABC transporter substrate-binding protein n=1 Tax=Bdellovibrio sp. HCB337 TaxID=3394358 RepID=UPI0039A68788
MFLRQKLDEKGMYFSLNPKDSDFATHETVLTNLVGTLVKLSETGQFEPYLAETFSTSEDGLTWTFNIRSNLACEDGTAITAQSFAEAFTLALKRYSKFSKVIDFELLEGWGSFSSGQSTSISGITYVNNRLIFKLTARPENFIGHLRLPYFGFWCSHNFNSDGSFKDDHKIISSGPYRVSHSAKNSILLEKRSDWFSISEDSPKEIHFSYATPDKLSDSSPTTVIEILGRDKVLNLPSFMEIKSPPSIMWAMIVSPIKKGPFESLKNRQAFADRITAAKKKSALFSSTLFYPSTPTDVQLRQHLTPYNSEMAGKKINFAFANRNYTQQEIDEIKKITLEALRDSSAEVEFHFGEPLENNWRHRLLSNREFDIRMNGVDQGGYPKNRTIKMMFCSNLGVCYPDPSGRICKVVDAQDRNGGPIPQAYISEFNQALYDDASVIPLTHFGTHWLASSDIDLKTLPPNSGIFHFEGIRLK